MNLNAFLNSLSSENQQVSFQETMAVIDANYVFCETRFSNGDVINDSGKNNGSCKIFAFALLNNLTQQQTLKCFGDYYRIDVLQNPEKNDHQNIRNFMRHGWAGIRFDSDALKPKHSQ